MPKTDPPSPDLVDDPRFQAMRVQVQSALLKAHHEGMPGLCLIACLVGQIMLIVEAIPADGALIALKTAINTLETQVRLAESEVPAGRVH